MRYVKPAVLTLEARNVIEALGPAAAFVSGPYGGGIEPESGLKRITQQ